MGSSYSGLNGRLSWDAENWRRDAELLGAVLERLTDTRREVTAEDWLLAEQVVELWRRGQWCRECGTRVLVEEMSPWMLCRPCQFELDEKLKHTAKCLELRGEERGSRDPECRRCQDAARRADDWLRGWAGPYGDYCFECDRRFGVLETVRLVSDFRTGRSWKFHETCWQRRENGQAGLREEGDQERVHQEVQSPGAMAGPETGGPEEDVCGKGSGQDRKDTEV